MVIDGDGEILYCGVSPQTIPLNNRLGMHEIRQG